MFTSNLTLDPDTVEEIRGQLPPSPTGDPNRLTAVGYDEGTVQCIALNLQGSGGTNAQPPRDGMLVAVEEILGASTPSLAGDNAAAFSLTLSEEGATILEQAFEDGLTPIGVIYSLKYTGIRPSLDVVIEADMSRVFDDLSMGLSAQVYWVQAGLDAEFEHLKQDGTIKITVTNYTSDQEMKDKENWALDFFKNQILADWFRPSLTPPPPLNPMGTTGTTGTTGNRTTNPVTSTPPRPSTPATSTPPRTSIPGVTGAGTSGGVPGATGSAIPGVGGTTPPRTTPAASGAPAATGGAGGSAIPGVSGAPGVGAGAAGGAASGGSAIPGVGGMPGVGGGVPGVGGGVPGVGGAAPGGGAPAGAGAGAAAAGGSSASPFGASFRLRYVSEEEKKTVRVEYHRSDAVQRTYAPQGFFGVLIPQDHREKYILEVDLDDPFFRQFTVNVGPAEGFDFGRIGLDSIHVAINYGDPNDAQNFKHGEFIFDTNNRAPQQWAVYRLDAYDRTYSYLVDYHFSPQAGWDAADDSYSLPAVTTEDEDLYLNPYEFLSFLEVKLVPGRIDWTVVDSIELFFSRDADASGWAPTKAFL